MDYIDKIVAIAGVIYMTITIASLLPLPTKIKDVLRAMSLDWRGARDSIKRLKGKDK